MMMMHFQDRMNQLKKSNKTDKEGMLGGLVKKTLTKTFAKNIKKK